MKNERQEGKDQTKADDDDDEELALSQIMPCFAGGGI